MTYFEDRSEAARRLIPHLSRFAGDDVVVMGVPRGAVPMGRIIADHYHWPLSIVLVKKVGHPMNPEYAIGAVGIDSVFIEKGHEDLSSDEIRRAVTAAQQTLRNRSERFLKGHHLPDLAGRTVIIVDDGIATGSTLQAAIRILRGLNPKKVVIAAPIASTHAVRLLRTFADEVVIIHESSTLTSIGEYYHDFTQVTDDEVANVLSS